MAEGELINDMKDKQPSWLEEVEDGVWVVTGKKDVKYKLEEQKGSVFEKVVNLSEKSNKSMESLLVVRSSVDPKLNDEDFENLRGIDYLRLKTAVAYIYGLNDFF